MNRGILIVVTLCMSICSLSCERNARARAEQEAAHEQTKKEIEAAQASLDALPAATAAEPERWGMRQWEFISTRASATFTPMPDAKETYQVTAMVWCRGETADGEPRKVRRKLVLKVTRAENGEWRLIDYAIVSEELLTFGQQARRCVAKCLGIPPSILLGLSLLIIFVSIWWHGILAGR
jgi:hypothetical protein